MKVEVDCWHENEADVSVEAVIEALKSNSENANRVVKKIAENLPSMSSCPTLSASKFAIITASESISDKIKGDLAPLFGKYFS